MKTVSSELYYCTDSATKSHSVVKIETEMAVCHYDLETVLSVKLQKMFFKQLISYK